jgi:hypothetical protein
MSPRIHHGLKSLSQFPTGHWKRSKFHINHRKSCDILIRVMEFHVCAWAWQYNGTYDELGDGIVVSCVCLAGTSSGAPARPRTLIHLRLSRVREVRWRQQRTHARGRPTTDRAVHLVSAASMRHLYMVEAWPFAELTAARRRPASSRAPLVGRCLQAALHAISRY